MGRPGLLGIPGPDRATPKIFGSKVLYLLHSGDGLVRDPGNGSGTGKFSLGTGIFYGPGLNFDSNEMTYINIHQRIKEIMTN